MNEETKPDLRKYVVTYMARGRAEERTVEAEQYTFGDLGLFQDVSFTRGENLVFLVDRARLISIARVFEAAE